MRVAIGIGLVLMASAMPARAADKLSKADLAAINSTPEQVAQVLELKDDPFASSIIVSSRPFFGEKNSNDQFLRAFIDRKTGKVDYQLYVSRVYGGSGWRFYNRIAVLRPDGPIDLKTERIGSDVNCYRYGCSYYETVVGDVDEATLKLAASDAHPGFDHRWRWKLFSQYSNTFEGDEAGLLNTEVAGFLLGVSQVRERLSLLKP